MQAVNLSLSLSQDGVFFVGHLQRLGDDRPHLPQVLLSVLGEQRRKAAFLEEAGLLLRKREKGQPEASRPNGETAAVAGFTYVVSSLVVVQALRRLVSYSGGSLSATSSCSCSDATDYRAARGTR